jgi:hypothetical protein
MKFDGLCNLALGKIARQSSTHKSWSLDDAVKALIDDGQRDCAFHTDIEDNPWWQVDLGAIFSLYYIVVGNRRKIAQERAITITMETSVDGSAWQLIHTGLVSWDDDLVWPLGGQASARFVRLSLKEKTYLHLSKVEVWGLPETGATPELERNADLWAETTRSEDLKELCGTLVTPTGPDEVIIDLEGDFHSIWGLELRKPKTDADSLQHIKIESSVDGRDWQIIHEGLLVWPERLYYPLQGEIIARFFKISLPKGDRAELPQVTVFSRVYHELEVWAWRTDGFGGRLMCMLTGLYIAKLLNCTFKFHWKEGIFNINDSGSQKFFVDKAENVFSGAFLQSHFCDPVPARFRPNVSKLAIARNISHRQLTNPYWHDLPGTINSVHKVILASLFHTMLTPPDYCYRSLFETLLFSPEYAKTADIARQADLPADYTALHIRSGDIIHNLMMRQSILRWSINGPFSSVKVAPLQLFKMTLEKLTQEKWKVILFGEDAELLAYLAHTYKCSTAADYLPREELTPSQRDFFELVIMSRASRIYANPESYFAKLASVIGGNIKIFDLHEMASDTEKLAYMEADLKKNENLYHPFQNAFSYMYLYHLTRQTASSSRRLYFLQQVMKYDPENPTPKLLKVTEYFKECQAQLGEDGLRDLFNIDFDYSNRFISFTYKNPFKKYILSSFFTAYYRWGYFTSLEDAAVRGNFCAATVISIIYEIAGIRIKAGALLMSVVNALHKMKNELAEMKNKYEIERYRNLKMKSSLSWKLTSPVRAIGRMLGLPKKK